MDISTIKMPFSTILFLQGILFDQQGIIIKKNRADIALKYLRKRLTKLANENVK